MAKTRAVRRAVGALGRGLRSERPPDSLSASKTSVLGQLYRGGSTTAAELADLERVQPQSLTRVLAELVEAGLIARRADPTDGRRQLLDISAEGRATLTGDMQTSDAWVARAMGEELSGSHGPDVEPVGARHCSAVVRRWKG